MKFSQYKQPFQKGFTLIELMIVVAIVGILAAVAIPAYNDYVQRAQASEAFSVVGGMQTAISAFAQENGTYPAAADITSGIGAAVTGKYSSAATTAGSGVITVTMSAASGADVTGKIVKFTPPGTIAGATSFPFACTSNAPVKFLPKSCTYSANP